MTTNKPKVWAIIDKHRATGVILIQHGHEKLVDGDRLIRLSDYEALQAECEKLRKDAERYRWLRRNGAFAPSAWGNGWALACGSSRYSSVELDASVDAAMQETSHDNQ